MFNYAKTVLSAIFELHNSEPLENELFNNARFNAIQSGNMYVERFADGDFINSRSNTFLGFTNIRPAFFYFVHILEAVTAFNFNFLNHFYPFSTLYTLRIEPE